MIRDTLTLAMLLAIFLAFMVFGAAVEPDLLPLPQ